MPFAACRAAKGITVATIFSHLAGSDAAEHNDYSHQQAKQFSTWADDISQGLPCRPLWHLCNSPAMLRFPEYHYDMVRLGIGLYGVDPTGSGQAQLKPISTLKTTVSQVKHVKAGDTVGYSRAGVATRDTTVATVAIGYADGYDRRFGKGVGYMLVNGQKAPVMGNVCMDMTMLDVTGIDVTEGDEVIVFGTDLGIAELASQIGTIAYEILTNVSDRVKRVYYTG